MSARRRLGGLVFALVWLSCAWFGSWEWNPNTATRLFAAFAIVEQGEATIDDYAALTIDRARFGDHVYSDKAPGMTLMALPAIAAVDALTGTRVREASLSLWDPASDRVMRARLRAATATGPAILTALAALCVFLMGSRIGGSNGAGVFAAAAFALGTPLWGWSTTLFGHAPVAALYAIAIWAVWQGTQHERASPCHAAVAGLALGWAIVVEYPAAIGGIVIGVWALARLRGYPPAERTRAMVAAAVPALAALAILAGYNVFAFGTPFRLGYQGVVGFEGMRQGLFGLTYPRAGVLYEILVGGRRGIVWVAPVLVVALPGIVRLIRDRATRDLGWLAVAGTLALFAYNAAYVYWDGGNSTGPRHAMPAVAFLSLGLAPTWAMLRSAGLRFAALALLAASVAINLVIASAEIVSGGPGAFPLWSDVVVARFANGQLRTLPSEWLGATPWQGLALYLLLAGALAISILRTLRRDALR